MGVFPFRTLLTLARGLAGEKVSLRPLTLQQKLRWGFVALLVVLGVITGTVTSPIMIYWFRYGRSTQDWREE
eukprot:SAG22_NODE_4716_length_1182_cov_1.344414_1_plen_71_part_10